MNNIKIGLVNGLLYYDYRDLITKFLDEANISYITSGKTTKKTLEDGKNLLVDESCLSLKIYFGHICELINKCDYILVIRCPSIRKRQMMCTNFYALYDLANNLFPNKIIELNIDMNNDISLKDAFINLGKKLNLTKKESSTFFKRAQQFFLKKRENEYKNQLCKLKGNKKKVLLVGHSYNLLDQYITGDIKNILKENDIEVLLSNYFNFKESDNYKKISNDVYWTKNIDILNAIIEYQKSIDGIILISTFPCGPDSLVNEMIMRKTNLPVLNLIIDEANENGGVTTRVESFIDIINMKEVIHDKN